MTNNDKIRKLSAAVIERMVDAGVEVTTIALMLRISRQTVYRWLSGGCFLPPMKECERIEKLFEWFAEIKADCVELVTSWNGKFHRATVLTLYKKPARRILESDLSFDEKVNKLTAHIFNTWAKEGKK